MPLYEHVFLSRQDVSAQQVETLTETFKGIIEANGGSIGKIEQWGLKSVAFRIRKNRKAHYTLMNIDAPAAAVAELERQQRINEDVLRVLTIRVDALEEGQSAMLQKRDRDDRDGDRGGHEVQVAHHVLGRPEEVAVDRGGVERVARGFRHVRGQRVDLPGQRGYLGTDALDVVAGDVGEIAARSRAPVAVCRFGEVGGVAQFLRQFDQIGAGGVDLVAERIDPVQAEHRRHGRERDHQEAGQVANPDRPDERRIVRHA